MAQYFNHILMLAYMSKVLWLFFLKWNTNQSCLEFTSGNLNPIGFLGHSVAPRPPALKSLALEQGWSKKSIKVVVVWKINSHWWTFICLYLILNVKLRLRIRGPWPNAPRRLAAAFNLRIFIWYSIAEAKKNRWKLCYLFLFSFRIPTLGSDQKCLRNIKLKCLA